MNNFIPIKGNFYRPIKLLAGTMLATILSTQGVSAKNLMPPASKIKNQQHKVDNKQVLLRRTNHGVVHVTASGYTGIGYGVGYAILKIIGAYSPIGLQR